MKKLFTLTLLAFAAIVSAQTTEATDSTEVSEKADASAYNRWSVELNAGPSKPLDYFTPGYYTSDGSKYFNFSDINHFNIGARYMFNQYFGAKLDFAYDIFQDQSGNGSLPFKTEQFRVGLQGVANLSRLMKFETFTSRFGLLGHAGLQVSYFDVKEGAFAGVNEDNGGYMVGLTPQFRISNRFVVTGDFTYFGNVRQHLNWDGQSFNDLSNNLTGNMLNTTIGLTIYLGKNDIHADWYVADDNKDKLEDLESRLKDLENGLKDSDNDGVGDMFDVEPNSAPNAMVDAKGRTIDENGNGVADTIENYFNNINNNKPNSSDFDIKRLINEKYVVVYFDFDVRNKPTDASIDAINFMVRYLNANPNANSDVIGYADELGASDYNDTLSKDRAELVKKMLMDSGINGSRLTTIGEGEDNSVDPASESARALVRRVTFFIK